MKTYTKSSSQVIGLDGKTLSLLAGHLIGRAVRLITSIGGVGTDYRERTSLRYWSLLQPGPQDLVEHGESCSFTNLPTFAAILRA